MIMLRGLERVPLLLLLLSGVAYAQPAWRELRSTEGRFAAKFPGTPQQMTKPMRTAMGNLTARLFLLEAKDQPFYAIAYVDYPKEKITGKKADELLDGARDSAVTNVGGKLAGEQKITLGGFPGRELRVEKIRGDMILVCRLYLVDERLYQALVVMPRAKESPEAIQPFFDGFAISR
jgi:hypothetical protein